MIMKKIKNVILTSIALVLIASFLITSVNMAVISAEANASKTNTSDTGNVESKEEVIYATLDPSGNTKQIYAVNILNVTKQGIVSDFGSYTSIKNLTSINDVVYDEDKISVEASPGRFYYQGDMNSLNLPWDIEIAYYLDTIKLSAEELAGKSGSLEIVIMTKPNEEVDSSFFDNYLLQIGLTLDTNKCDNIVAEGSTMANAGTDKVITFTVMPAAMGNITIRTDVTDFSMEGIEFSAVPFSMNIELPDTSGLTDNFDLLSGALNQLNDGISAIQKGVSEMSSGTTSLKNGSLDFNAGIDEISAKSEELVGSSSSISSALSSLSTSLTGALDSNDLSALSELPTGLVQLSSGLDEISGGLTDLATGYATAYTALSTAIETIPDTEISAEALQKLSASNPNDAALNQLLEVYTAARTVKGTYQMVSKAFTAVEPNLTSMATSLDTISSSLNTIGTKLATSHESSDLTSSITQLSTGIATLSNQYKAFHTGLKGYTGGVSDLASAYNGLNMGITELSDGTEELYSGIRELGDGSGELVNQTDDLPEQIEATIEELMADYDTSDYTPISFVSSQNTNVASVQFVLKTDKIEKEELPKAETQQTKKENFWTRLRDLFV
jgi:X-X-X-Leu-X-X-Gly heptad repeat protein